MAFGLDVLRALEHHVLEEVREAGAARLARSSSRRGTRSRRARSASNGLPGTRPAARWPASSSCNSASEAGRPPCASGSTARSAAAATRTRRGQSLPGKCRRSWNLDYRRRGWRSGPVAPASSFELARCAARGRRRACAARAACGTPPTTFSQSRLGMAGYPEMKPPARPNWECRSARSRSRPCRCVRWPATPTWPASVTPILDDAAAGDADLRREQHVPPHADAVRDLDQVVDLRAGADARLADGRTIDRRIRADLHVVFDDDAADLRNLFVGAVAATREAEAVAADHDAVLQHDAAADADALADRDLGVDDAVVADLRKASDRDVRMHDRSRADPRALGRRPRTRRCWHRRAMVAPGSTCASRCTPAGGRQRVGEQRRPPARMSGTDRRRGEPRRARRSPPARQ